MLETPHVAVGVALASKIPNPFIAIPLAFLSHFALEKVPHWNPHLNTETKKFGYPAKKSITIVVIDSTLALTLGLAFAFKAMPNTAHAVTILAASFASVLPDVIEAPYYFLKMRSKLIEKWISFQKSLQVDTIPSWGLLTQIITIAASILWIRS